MNHLENYNNRLPELLAIGDDSVVRPIIPVHEYGKEADWLYEWAQEDQAALTANGLGWTLVEDLPIRASVLFQAQLNWRNVLLSDRPAAEAWESKRNEGIELEGRILRALRFAFSDSEKQINQLENLDQRTTYAGLIYNLGELSDMGRKNPDLLAAVNFDMTLLDAADTMMDELRTTWSAAVSERSAISEKKTLRDRAYTYLKLNVDKIRKCGKYTFFGNDDRRKGYYSAYYRTKKNKQTEPDQNQELPQDTVVDPIEVKDQAA